MRQKSHNWSPGAVEGVADLGDLARFRLTQRAVLRTHPDVLRMWGLEDAALRDAPARPASDEVDVDELIEDWLRALPQDVSTSAEWTSVRRALLLRRRIIDLPNGRYALIAVTPRRAQASTEDDDGSFLERELTIDRHCMDVRSWVERFARSLSLEAEVSDDLMLAARLHDLGKADPRFQLWLVDGNPVRHAMLGEPLAKSIGAQADRASRERARVRAGYPRGYRHELLSVAMMCSDDGPLESAHDRDLVLHLVASHHGHCRPFAPTEAAATEDIDVKLELGGHVLAARTRHGYAAVDSGISDRFWTLTRRYGWWRLAFLEAILRLADHRASEAGAG